MENERGLIREIFFWILLLIFLSAAVFMVSAIYYDTQQKLELALSYYRWSTGLFFGFSMLLAKFARGLIAS